MKELPAPFLKMVQDDIKRIQENLECGSSEEHWELFRELDGRYQACVKDWYKGMWQSSRSGSIMYYPELHRDPQGTISNLKLIKAKLETYQYQMNATSTPETVTPQVNVTTNVGVHISFEQVRSQIVDMPSLTNEQTKEVLEKVDELEKVINGQGSRKSKWEKVKPVLTWLANKSCDVGMAILPLLLKIQS